MPVSLADQMGASTQPGNEKSLSAGSRTFSSVREGVSATSVRSGVLTRQKISRHVDIFQPVNSGDPPFDLLTPFPFPALAYRPLDLRGILCLLLLDPRSRAFHCHHKGRRLEPLHGTNFTLLDVSCLSGDLGQPGEGRTKEEKQWNKSLMDQDWSPPSGLTLKCLCLCLLHL